jgi:4-hydroxybenzoate polyprenyltransferase
MNEGSQRMVLCVDLDDTLIRTDLSVESLLGALKRSPWLVLLVPWWLLQGRSVLKAQLARRADIDVAVLPYRAKVLQLVEAARTKGQMTALVTGSNQRYAQAINEHLGMFDRVHASDERRNLTGRRKAALLVEEYGEGGFEYVANGRVDLPVWAQAGRVVTVNASKSLLRALARLGKPQRNIDRVSIAAKTWMQAIRIQQWVKNALLFVPILTAHRLLDVVAISNVFKAFLVFGLVASATYIVNDLFDLDSDRHHDSKRHRPFAAGTLSAKAGLALSGALLASGIAIALVLPVGFQLSLLAYLVLTLLYSLRLKRVVSLDVIVLAGLYTLRVIAGAFAAGVPLSFWLLAFSMFIFLCLALVKRVAELIELQKKEALAEQEQGKVPGRDYKTADISILQILGATSGYLAVLVVALYINSEEVTLLYRTPEILWLIAPLLLLWVTRLWVATTRGFMDEDPLLFAIKDPKTWLSALITAGILAAATVV